MSTNEKILVGVGLFAVIFIAYEVNKSVNMVTASLQTGAEMVTQPVTDLEKLIALPFTWVEQFLGVGTNAGTNDN